MLPAWSSRASLAPVSLPPGPSDRASLSQGLSPSLRAPLALSLLVYQLLGRQSRDCSPREDQVSLARRRVPELCDQGYAAIRYRCRSI